MNHTEIGNGCGRCFSTDVCLSRSQIRGS